MCRRSLVRQGSKSPFPIGDNRPLQSTPPSIPLSPPTPSGSYGSASMSQSRSNMSTIPGKQPSTPSWGMLPTVPPSPLPQQGQGQVLPPGSGMPGQMGYQGQYVSPNAPTSYGTGQFGSSPQMPPVGPPSMSSTDQDQQQPKRKQRISRRKVVIGLAGLVGVLVVSSGATAAWYELSHQTPSPAAIGSTSKTDPSTGKYGDRRTIPNQRSHVARPSPRRQRLPARKRLRRRQPVLEV